MADSRRMTMTDKKNIEAELAELRLETAKVAEEIATARGFGDLSENAEYDAAKDREYHVHKRISELEHQLRTVTFVDDTATSTDSVALGHVVRVLDIEYNEEDSYTLVGPTEANPRKMFISNESPIGIALMGSHVGDTVEIKTPGGLSHLKILEISKR